MKSLTIRRPDDFHLHLRSGKTLEQVIKFSAENFGYGLVMPNTNPPILTAEDAERYRAEIIRAYLIKYLDLKAHTLEEDTFKPLLSLYMTEETTPEMIYQASKVPGLVAVKMYPKGGTTNSHNGVSNFKKLFPVFRAMEEMNMLLLIHGQKPDSFILDREKDFIPTLEEIAFTFKNLRIVAEHISTAKMVNWIYNSPKNVAATITAHHLFLTLDDVLASKSEGREGLNPHNYCQPVLQRPEDKEALTSAATSGSQKFFLGSDSAPHDRKTKETSCGCAGIFSAPVLLPTLAEVFESCGALNRLENFVSVHGAKFYGLEPNKGRITLTKEKWKVPEEIEGIVPFRAGQEISWKVV